MWEKVRFASETWRGAVPSLSLFLEPKIIPKRHSSGLNKGARPKEGKEGGKSLISFQVNLARIFILRKKEKHQWDIQCLGE